MTSTGADAAYILMFDADASWITHVSWNASTSQAEMRRLGAVPDFPRAPRLIRDKSLHGIKQLETFYKLFQDSRMPIGLVADSSTGSLYVLGKDAMRDQRTAWWLVEVDPQSGEKLKSTRLPTHAAHLVAPVFGEERVTMIEKGLIHLIGNRVVFRETDSMVVTPKAWIDGSVSYRQVEGRAVFDCDGPTL